MGNEKMRRNKKMEEIKKKIEVNKKGKSEINKV